jgi:hypothetical protein
MAITQVNLYECVNYSITAWLQQLKTKYTAAGYAKTLNIVDAYPSDFTNLYLPTVSFSMGDDVGDGSDLGKTLIYDEIACHIEIFAGSVSIKSANQNKANERELRMLLGMCKSILQFKYIDFYDTSVTPILEQPDGIEVKDVICSYMKFPNAPLQAERYRGFVDFSIAVNVIPD